MKSLNDYKNDLEGTKKEFIQRLKSTKIPKSQLKDFLEYIENNGFYIAPCSKSYHGAWEGGLLVHSMMVCDLLLDWDKRYGTGLSYDTIVITTLLHDVKKMFDYAKKFKDGEWKWVGVYPDTVTGELAQKLYGKDKAQLHGSASVDIITQFFNLTERESAMITWHMGVYTEYYEAKPGQFLEWSADRKNNNVNAALLLYFADHFSTMVRED